MARSTLYRHSRWIPKRLSRNHNARRPFSSTLTRCAEEDAFPNALPRSQRRPPASDSSRDLGALYQRFGGRTPTAASTAASRETLAQLALTTKRRELEASSHRLFKVHDVYSPHDLSATEQTKIRTSPRQLPQCPVDPFKALGLDPVRDCYRNFSIMAEFCTRGGRIKGRRETGLGNVSQRKMAKAVRRAVGMGLIPSVHEHPEVVENRRRMATERQFGKDGESGHFAPRMFFK